MDVSILQLMGTPDFTDLSRLLVESLTSVATSTERVYGQMGERYPVMVRELEAAFGGAGIQEDLAAGIQTILQGIQDHEARYALAREESKEQLVLWRNQAAVIEAVAASIDEIREDSILMELLSLNAMVIASKAGAAGRAFGCITTELKSLSNQSMALTEEVSRRKNGLHRIFVEFEDGWEQCEKREQENFVEFLSEIRGVFGDLNSGSAQISEGLAKIHGKSRAVREPLVKIMIEIQNQDRIRQGLDHVQLTIDEFLVRSESKTAHARLDELSYLELLPDLSSQVLDEIVGQIQQNRSVFAQSLVEAGALIERLEQERRAFLGASKANTGFGLLDSSFVQGERLFSGFVDQTQSLLRDREALVHKGLQLQKSVAEMVDFLHSFEAQLPQFRNIDVASRIQVARHSELVSMRDNTLSMTNLTRKIESDVGRSVDLASAFVASVQKLFQDYQVQFTERFRATEELMAQGQQAVGRLKQVQEQMIEAVDKSELFTSAFTDQFSQTKSDLNGLGELLKTITNQQGNLRSIKNHVQDEKRRIMDELGVTDWKLDKKKLRAMVDRFTIFTHKKFAAELGDFEVEQNVESGEVTLF